MERLKSQQFYKLKESRNTVLSGLREFASRGTAQAKKEAQAAKTIFNTSLALGTVLFTARAEMTKPKKGRYKNDIPDIILTPAEEREAKKEVERIAEELRLARAEKEAKRLRLIEENNARIAAAKKNQGK